MIEIIFNSFENIFCFVFFWVKFMILCKKYFFWFLILFLLLLFLFGYVYENYVYFLIWYFLGVLMIVSFNCIENCL